MLWAMQRLRQMCMFFIYPPALHTTIFTEMEGTLTGYHDDNETEATNKYKMTIRME